jgi:hypothetical protein
MRPLWPAPGASDPRTPVGYFRTENAGSAGPLRLETDRNQTCQPRAYAVQPGGASQLALLAQCVQMRGPMVGVRVSVADGCGAKEVEVDAVHGLRPKVNCLLGMPENLQYS